MCRKSEFNIIIEQMKKIYEKAFGENIVRIFLYGSYARGDYNEFSDIDLAAIAKGDRITLQKILEEVWDEAADLGLEYDTIISPTVIPFDEFERSKEILPYYRNIEAEGVVISA